MRTTHLLLGMAIAMLVASCGRSKQTDAITRGKMTVLVDETFYPMMEAQAEVFEHFYRFAKVDLQQEPEGKIMGLMRDNDSLRVAVLSRDLNDAEKAYFNERNLVPRVTPLASDAIALIVNKNEPMSQISVDDLRALLTDTHTGGKMNLVFDSPSSSTVQYMNTLAGEQGLNTSSIYSVENTSALLKYISENSGSIGFVGIDWLYEPGEEQRQFLDKIKVLSVGSPETGYFKPTQDNIAGETYPFIRKLYYINCQGSASIGMGFASFIAGRDIGQRIILKSGLVPDRFPKREIKVRKKL